MPYSRPCRYISSSSGYRYAFPYRYDPSYELLKTEIPFRDGIPCTGDKGYSYGASTCTDWLWHYLWVPFYDRLNGLHTTTCTIQNNAITYSNTSLNSVAPTGTFYLYHRPYGIAKPLYDTNYSNGTISGITYKDGASASDVGDFMYIPVIDNRRYIMVSFVYNILCTAKSSSSTFVNFCDSNASSDYNGIMQTRQCWWNGNRLSPSQFAANADNFVTWPTVGKYSTGFKSELGQYGGSYDSMQGTNIYVWDGTHSGLYIELPRVRSVGIRTSGSDISGTVELMDLTVTVAEFNPV